MPDSFVHLHQHTEYSMLDGAARVDDAVMAAVADGQPAMGITDHGNMYGVLPFYKACKDNGINPIIGTEAYMARETRDERPSRRGRQDDSGGDTDGGHKLYYHLTLLAEDNTGYKNLIQLASRAFMEGYYYKPRVDWDLLSQHHSGVIATTGCLGGHVLQALMNQGFDAALEKAARLQDIFGRDNLFVEIQDHGLADQHATNPQLLEIARRLKAPLVATNDSHYVNQEDAVAHDALLCVQTRSLVSDTKRFKFEGDQHYLKSAAEMRRLFSGAESSCDNTLWIAERCNVEIEFGKVLLPNFPIPEGFQSDEDYLEHLTMEGARTRWGQQLPDAVVSRLSFELKTIADMGFSSYFVITWDLIQYARRRGIRVGPGRGSAAGCAVAYCLEITDLDPIKYDLLFERFLNPSRLSMPDIDMDFDSRYKDEMIRYAAERYGRDRVAQIITFSTIKARAAVRDAARVLGKDYSLGDRIAKAVPEPIMGRDTPLHACFEEKEKYADGYKMAGELRDMYELDGDARQVIDVARGLEGLRRQDSIHAAAVVITKEPLTEYLPIQRKPAAGQDPEDAPVVTQYEMGGVEDLGLLKMDFLGLRNLDVISDTLELIRETSGVELDIDHVNLDDAPTFELLQRADTMGVFQLEGTQMRALMKSLEPTNFDDVAALVALYRPGPMAANMHTDYADRKNGRQEVTFLHPDAEEILGDTYGLCIYQEGIMRIAQKFAGYSLAEADNLRKACGKKNKELIAAERTKFVSGCNTQGYGADLGEAWFDIIEPFADYAFNKSHSYGYGLVAYQTAYLKANHPLEYFSALLTSAKTKLEKAAVYLADCRSMGITVSVPDINQSKMDFFPETSDPNNPRILFGLSAVRNVGEGIVQQVIAERDESGPFEDFFDFCARVPTTVLAKRAIESLIHAGAFDSVGHPRKGLLQVFEPIIDDYVARRREHDMGVLSLFGQTSEGPTFDNNIAVPQVEFDKFERLEKEREMLGLYVSDHPMAGLEQLIARKADCSVAEAILREQGTKLAVGGVITALQKKWTRKGELMAVFVLEDLEQSVEVMVFPKTMTVIGHLLQEQSVVMVTGRVDTRDETPKLIALDLELVDVELDDDPPLRLKLPVTRMDNGTISDMKNLLLEFPGPSEVHILLDSGQILRLNDDTRVDLKSGLIGELRVLLGSSAVVA